MIKEAKDIVKKAIDVKDTLMLAQELQKLDLSPSRIDIGKLNSEWLQEKGKFKSATEFIGEKLKNYSDLAKMGRRRAAPLHGVRTNPVLEANSANTY